MRFIADQLAKLKEYFALYPNPSQTRKKGLAKPFGVSACEINNWFECHRDLLKNAGKLKSPFSRRTPEELQVLRAVFLHSLYPTADQYSELENRLSAMSRPQVLNWFRRNRKLIRSGQAAGRACEVAVASSLSPRKEETARRC